MKLKLTNFDPTKPPVVLDQFPVIVGLDPGADVCLDDSSLGHYQCMIDFGDGGLMVWDLGTRLGTWVNDRRVLPKLPLHSGDTLRFGKSQFVVHYDDGIAKSLPSDREIAQRSSSSVPSRRTRRLPAPV
jgi:pSer/pThr/pTyr-binding forkhead associated (FHA) protein